MPHYPRVMSLKLGRVSERDVRVFATSETFVISGKNLTKGETTMASYKQQNVELMERLTAAVGKMIEQEQDITNLRFENLSLRESIETEHKRLVDDEHLNSELKKSLREMQESNELSARIIRKLLNAMDKMEGEF